jgi:membrane dipeptidase
METQPLLGAKSKKSILRYFVPILVIIFVAQFLPRIDLMEDPSARISRLIQIQPIADTHNDLPMKLRILEDQGRSLNISNLSIVDTDLNRLSLGGIGIQFWSGYIPCFNDNLEHHYIKTTLEQIDLIKRMVRYNSNYLQFATSVQGIKDAIHNRKIASLIGLEGGHQIGESLAALRLYYEMGVRYLTLSHVCHTSWVDSAALPPLHNGLTDFGKEIVAEMNRFVYTNQTGHDGGY